MAVTFEQIYMGQTIQRITPKISPNSSSQLQTTLFFFFFFFFPRLPQVASISSWARNWNHTRAMTQATAVTTPDPQQLGHQEAPTSHSYILLKYKAYWKKDWMRQEWTWWGGKSLEYWFQVRIQPLHKPWTRRVLAAFQFPDPHTEQDSSAPRDFAVRT